MNSRVERKKRELWFLWNKVTPRCLRLYVINFHLRTYSPLGTRVLLNVGLIHGDTMRNNSETIRSHGNWVIDTMTIEYGKYNKNNPP